MAQNDKKNGPGRPRKAVPDRQTVPLGLRVSGELKSKLEEAADANGRSQSQEAEFRLRRSFEIEDRRRDLALLLDLIASVEALVKRSWKDDPIVCRTVMGLADAYFRRFGPDELKGEEPTDFEERRSYEQSLDSFLIAISGAVTASSKAVKDAGDE
jgi:hypothetical protein